MHLQQGSKQKDSESKKLSYHFSKRLVRITAVAAIAVLVALALARTSWQRALENAYSDWWLVLAGERYAPRHIAVVAIDDETLLALKDELARFLGAVRGRR